MIAQDLWQAHYQILSIIFWKEFIELDINTNMVMKNIKLLELNISIKTFFLEYRNFKHDLIEHKCFCCNKNYLKKFGEKLKERIFDTNSFSHHDNNKFIPLLQNHVYPYQYTNDWEKFMETFIT